MAHPHFVSPTRLDIDSRPNAECLFFGLGVVWIADSELAFEDEVCGQPRMTMRRIVGVGPVRPREDVAEPPIGDLLFGILSCRCGHAVSLA